MKMSRKWTGKIIFIVAFSLCLELFVSNYALLGCLGLPHDQAAPIKVLDPDEGQSRSQNAI